MSSVHAHCPCWVEFLTRAHFERGQLSLFLSLSLRSDLLPGTLMEPKGNLAAPVIRTWPLWQGDLEPSKGAASVFYEAGSLGLFRPSRPREHKDS